MKKKILLILLALVIVSVPIYIFFIKGNTENQIVNEEKQLYTCGMHPEIISDEPGICPICEMQLVPLKKGNQKNGERKILFYRHPMNPEIISDHPQKDEMGMDFIPVYEDEMTESNVVVIDPQVEQNMNIKTTNVEVKELSSIVVTNGILQTNEQREYIVTTKIDGWVEKLYVNYTGQNVSQGSKLMDIYSPELVAAQQELITALSYQSSVQRSSIESIKESGNQLVINAIRKLELLDVPESEIQRIIDTKEIRKTVTLYAQKSGTVLEKNVLEGQKVMAGMPLLKIADLTNLWLIANIYEYELSKINLGSKATLNFNFLPGKNFQGRVTFIYPTVDPQTRTVKLRIELRNDGNLKPSMFANVTIEGKKLGTAPVVPEDAVIRSGLRDVVILYLGDGKYKIQEVKLGAYSNGYYQVLDGLMAGNKIVTSAQFLIDSESNLRSAVNKFKENKTESQSNMNEKKVGDSGKSSKEEVKSTELESDKAQIHGHSHSIIHSGIIDVESLDKNKDGKLFECPMDWNVISDSPGNCPVCNMKLKEYTLNQVKENLQKHGYKYKK